MQSGSPEVVGLTRTEDEQGRISTGRRETVRRDPTNRTTVPEIVYQPVTITNENGVITVEPVERDLYDGEQVKWVCQENAWEIRFDPVHDGNPFANDVFGPGLLPSLTNPANEMELPIEETFEDNSGPVRGDAAEGLYSYSIQVGEFGPLQARIKFIRGPRPR